MNSNTDRVNGNLLQTQTKKNKFISQRVRRRTQKVDVSITQAEDYQISKQYQGKHHPLTQENKKCQNISVTIFILLTSKLNHKCFEWREIKENYNSENDMKLRA